MTDLTSRGRAVATALVSTGALVVALAACSSSSKPSGGDGSTGGSTAAKGDPRVASVTITGAKGCEADRLEFSAGPITFKITNKDAAAVSEVELLSGQRIVGEKENIPPGFNGEFAVNVGAGSYTMYCPGGNPERTTVKVTGKASAAADEGTAALLKTATKNYGAYVSTQVGVLLMNVTKLDTALHGSNVRAAQDAYMRARPFYEKIEPVAESFTIGKDNLDANIDARVHDVSPSKFIGFHRIERGLFVDKSLTGLATFGDGLVANVKKLQKLTAGLTYQPTELANGAQELLDEVASSKITGEEEAYSHIDMLDFANNDEGAEQAFAQLQPALDKIDPALSKSISTQFTALDKLVDSYRTAANPSGFKLYTSLTAADKRSLAAAVKAVQEPLSKVASKVANA